MPPFIEPIGTIGPSDFSHVFVAGILRRVMAIEFRERHTSDHPFQLEVWKSGELIGHVRRNKVGLYQYLRGPLNDLVFEFQDVELEVLKRRIEELETSDDAQLAGECPTVELAVTTRALLNAIGLLATQFGDKVHVEAWRVLTAESAQRELGYPARPLKLSQRAYEALPRDVKTALGREGIA